MTPITLEHAKISNNFLNPLDNGILVSNEQLMDISNLSDKAVFVKTQVQEYLEDHEVNPKDSQRIIKAANNLLSLMI